MDLITRKPTVKSIVAKCLGDYSLNGLSGLSNSIQNNLLTKKIKFPLLEYAAHLFYEAIPVEEHVKLCDKIDEAKTIGGNVIIAIILQNRLSANFKESFEKAAEYISKTDSWHICDIVGERVFGYALLHEPKKSFPEFHKLAGHESFWVVRSLGAGAHYAIKKGLGKKDVITLFELLLSLANSKQKEIKQGTGWAAKTTAKFHPDVIEHFKNEIESTEKVGQWFRGKIKIGLNRNLYAEGNNS